MQSLFCVAQSVKPRWNRWVTAICCGSALSVSTFGIEPPMRSIPVSAEVASRGLGDVPNEIKLLPLPGRVEPPVITAVAIRGTGEVAAAGDDHVIRLLKNDLKSEESLLVGHRDWVQSMVFSPDGTRLISAGNDGAVWIWEQSNEWRGKLLLQRTNTLQQLAINRNGDQLAMGGFNGPIVLYSFTTGTVEELRCECPEHRALCFSPDGSYLATGGADGVLRIWDLKTHRIVEELPLHQGRIRAITFSDDGLQVATASEDRQVVLYDLIGKQLSGRFELGGCKALSLCVISDHHLAVGGTDNTIRFLDLKHGSECNRLSGHDGSVAILRCDGDRLFSGSFDTSLRVWSIATALSHSELGTLPISSKPEISDEQTLRRQ